MKNNFRFYLTWNDNNFLPFQRVLVKSDKSKVLYALVFYIYIYIFRFTFSDTYFRPRTQTATSIHRGHEGQAREKFYL